MPNTHRLIIILMTLLWIVTPGMISAIPTSNISIDAEKFEVDGETNTVLAIGNVVVKKQDMTMTSDKARYNQFKQEITLLGNVLLKQNDLQLTADQVQASDKGDQVTAKGNIDFKIKKIQGNADHAIYNSGKKTAILNGNARVFKDLNELKGKTIIVDIQDGHVKSKGNAKLSLTKEGLSAIK